MIRSCGRRRRERVVSYAVLATAAALASEGALAEDHAVGAKAGLLGLGVEYAHSIGDRWAVRVGWNGSELGFGAEESDIDYDFDLVWDSLAVGFDFYPTRGALRLSAGVLRNDNRLEARSVLDDEITIGGTTYAADDVGTLTGLVKFDDRAFFAGIGWDWSRRRTRGVGVSFDIGILSHGSPKVSLRASGPIADIPEFEDDLAAEEAELADEIGDFDLLPFATVGVVFRF